MSKPYVTTESPVPPRIAAVLARFLEEMKTGNVTLNIKDGKILGAKVEELVRG